MTLYPVVASAHTDDPVDKVVGMAVAGGILGIIAVLVGALVSFVKSRRKPPADSPGKPAVAEEAHPSSGNEVDDTQERVIQSVKVWGFKVFATIGGLVVLTIIAAKIAPPLGSSTELSNHQGHFFNITPGLKYFVSSTPQVFEFADTKKRTKEDNAKPQTLSANDIERLTENAQNGDAIAQMNVGNIYYKGQGVPQNYANAAKWYIQAAEQGIAEAQCMLGFMYDKGYGVPQNYAEALKWSRKAADQGFATAQLILASMYDNGHGVPQDYAEAMKWYRKAADQGEAVSQDNLGAMYERGHGVARDYSEAIRWYRKAAENGDADAENSLGTMYFEGNGVPQNYEEAYAWLSVAAAQSANDANKNHMIVENRDLVATHLTPPALLTAQQHATKYFADYVKHPSDGAQ
jgi:TPR repeat protein